MVRHLLPGKIAGKNGLIMITVKYRELNHGMPVANK
jgi:hypothetical protein